MVSVTEVSAVSLGRGPWTVDDLAQLPDDGLRHELIDGLHIVSPSPVTMHQRIIGNLYLVLRAGCPDDLEVFLSPFDVVLARDTVLEPDLLVARRSDLTAANLPATPVLAVEVLSPSTRRYDRLLKRDRLEAAGCPSYWLVDPDEVSITALDLLDGRFQEVGHAIGPEALSARRPWPVRVVPEALTH